MGEGLPQIGTNPITPFQAACMSYVATHPAVDTIGYNSDGSRVHGYVSASAFSVMLTVIPDGFRAGEIAAPHVFVQTTDLIPRISQIVFYTRAFGPCAIHVFLRRYPTLTLFHFFSKSFLTKNPFFILNPVGLNPATR